MGARCVVARGVRVRVRTSLGWLRGLQGVGGCTVCDCTVWCVVARGVRVRVRTSLGWLHRYTGSGSVWSQCGCVGLLLPGSARCARLQGGVMCRRMLAPPHTHFVPTLNLFTLPPGALHRRALRALQRGAGARAGRGCSHRRRRGRGAGFPGSGHCAAWCCLAVSGLPPRGGSCGRLCGAGSLRGQ
jgi:hypothetical protein